jgi:hypothetical protein
MPHRSLITRGFVNRRSGVQIPQPAPISLSKNSRLPRTSKPLSSAEIDSPTLAELKKPRITVCVCTCQRQQMLRRYLDAISTLTWPEGAGLSIIVVDNEPEPNNRSIVEEFGAIYVHEPVAG